MLRIYLILFIVISLSACLPIQSIFLGMPDAKDLERFTKHSIETDTACFQFYKQDKAIKTRFKITDWTSDIPFFVPLEQTLKNHKVRACLIIKNDTILSSYYAKGMNAETIHSSYSVAKSFVSALVGIAIDEGFIKSELDLVIKYLPKLKGGDELKELTLKHLLNHTSGIKYDLLLDATIYYGTDIQKGIQRIKFIDKPGTKQHYINVNTQLLGMVLEAATGQLLSQYLEQKIWKPLGMCQEGLWGSDKKGQERTFCCMGATALDYAKFASLYLNQGNWQGTQLISQKWHQKSICRDTSEGSSFNYNYSWYIGLKEYGDYMAIGLFKQYLYINPRKKIIIVLLNDQEKSLKAERVLWKEVFRQIVDQL
jgi:CubicO group peptidase (beta-lactamase class C family)